MNDVLFTVVDLRGKTILHHFNIDCSIVHLPRHNYFVPFFFYYKLCILYEEEIKNNVGAVMSVGSGTTETCIWVSRLDTDASFLMNTSHLV